MTVHASDIQLVRTCTAYPEQYDAWHEGKLVGCLRLRGGWFYAACPDLDGDYVYDMRDPVMGGVFATDAERDRHLNAARAAIARWLNARDDR